ncbi:MAG: class I tRNA ligase family protein, partial [bacterium]|nr:class I tRNA ligase family protein [bacterium]
EWLPITTAIQEIKDPLHSYALSRFLTPSAYVGDGLLRNSGQFDGRDNREAMGEIIDFVGGERVTNYRLRDWLVSRQRHWGCPIPVVYDPQGAPHLIPYEHLPWTLPTDVDFSPSAESPLATSKELKERVERIFGEGWTPEYDTLDTFVDSSWYFLRYLDSKDENDFSDQSLMKKWLPVNRYSGGSEHTTMHLLYSRFFHKALYDLALVPTPEPFEERFNRGLILGTDGQKMSKRWGNVVNPDEVLAKLGSDAVRMYLAFIGPYNEPGSYPWKLDGAVAMRKFLDRVCQLSEKVTEGEMSESERTSLAKAVKKVTGDTERFKFNTAISGHMVFVRELESAKSISKEIYLALVSLMAPFAPHLAEHLWEKMGAEGSVHTTSWPQEIAIEEDAIVIGVQVNGKRRAEIALAPDASEEEAMEAARANETISRLLHEGSLEKIVYVPGRILNMVIT